jgi:hypothetical protein
MIFCFTFPAWHANPRTPTTLGPSLRSALAVCRADVAAVWLTQYKVWPFVDWINFSYVPEPLRVVFSSLVTLFWNIYLAGALAGAA